jgi:DNA polymerase III delta prime subunit
MWQTFGHKNQKDFLEQILESKNYSHAYLFCGPAEVGKKTLATEFASKLLGLEPGKASPDLISWGGDKYKIEDVRNLISELSLKPFQAEYKVAVLDNCENMTEEAANSILKTLEEPNASTILILITANKKLLLPTILSRVQVLNFNRLSSEELSEFLINRKLSDLEHRVALAGKAGKAERILKDQTLLEQTEKHSIIFEGLRAKGLAQRLLNIKEYAELETEELVSVMKHWLDHEHEKFLSEPKRYKNLQLLIEAIDGLKRNLNKKLVLEKLFLGVS